MPDFTIIAGPNGAGKSTYSTILSSSDALLFDADKVKTIRAKQYPDVPAESIEMMIDSAYWEVEENAIEGEKDLTVETNLRDDFLINRAQFFKNKGFTINLIYMLLPDIETSTERVSLRTALKGHFIDPESVKYNFEQGLIMLKKHFSKFDNLEILDTSLNDSLAFPKRLLVVKNNKINYFDPTPPF